LVTAGGKAVAAAGSVADGDKVIGQAVKAFGTVHILINNAGILREWFISIDHFFPPHHLPVLSVQSH
jgi:NAD(P)-dependent dehydrogenase (short-subunit alcohol dehydrogenase family)